MTAQEIAETLINGNIARARENLLRSHDGFARTAYEAAVMALDVERELATLIWGDYAAGDEYGAWESAHQRVRRCLEGAP